MNGSLVRTTYSPSSTQQSSVLPGQTLEHARRRTHTATQSRVPDIQGCVNLGRVMYNGRNALIKHLTFNSLKSYFEEFIGFSEN